MMDRSEKLSAHFALGEMVPLSAMSVPDDVLHNLVFLCSLLEVVREELGVSLVVHDAWRPPEHNAAVGGAKASDHLTGSAADFHAAAGGGRTWEENTLAAFAFIRTALSGRFGQVIIEDHRAHYGKPGKLWVHLAILSHKHQGRDDASAVLTSDRPGQYAAHQGGVA
jgi:hypothetical protein